TSPLSDAGGTAGRSAARSWRTTGSSVSACWWRREVKPRSHVDQIWQRTCPHLLHHLSTVRLHGDFADTEVTTHLLVQSSGNNQRHYLALAATQGRVTFS